MNSNPGNKKILTEMYESLITSLNKWYPLSVDKDNGGYFPNLNYDWQIDPVSIK